MNLERQPTIYDVAARAGVSRSTVSRVINGDARVSDESRLAVIHTINELGYTPNGTAQSLARTRRG